MDLLKAGGVEVDRRVFEISANSASSNVDGLSILKSVEEVSGEAVLISV